MKQNIVNALTAMVLVLVLAGIILIARDANISGFATRQKASQDVIDKINQDGAARVIVFLKEDKINPSQSRKEVIKQKQDNVLSKLNYVDSNKKSNPQLKRDLTLKYRYSNINAFSGNITRDGLAKLELDPDIDHIVLVRVINVLLTTSIPLIEADKVWGQKINGINLTGKDQSICILDTGVDYTHESLGGCTATNVSEHKCKVIAGYDFVNSDTNPADDNGHGTHVAGIAAANGSVVGVARGANIVAIKVLGSDGRGDDADLIAGIDWCTNNATRFNISVISMSLGDQEIHTAANCPTTVDSALQSAVAENITVLAASGNQNSNLGINYPACSPYAIAVGASDNSDNMAAFTNTYSLLDIVAPGVDITSTANGGGTTTLSGTSMATPHAAGVAALINQKEKLLNNRWAKQSEILSLFKLSNVSVSDSGLSFPRINALISVNNILELSSADNSANGNEVRLKFKTSTNLENISEAFVMKHNFISLNSSKYSVYNKTANVTFYNLSFSKAPIVLRNGNICPDCFVLKYDTENLTFNVSHFTNYTSAANSQLKIFDQVDSEGGSRIAKAGLKPTYFYANYTNRTSNEPVLAADCAINISTINGIMIYNTSSRLYEYNMTFSTSDTYPYNVTCSQTDYEGLNLSDNIFISPACLDQTPNTDITIPAGRTINCTNELLKLRNQSILINGGLVLNDTVIFIELTGTTVRNISVYDKSNLTLDNVVLNGTSKSQTIYSFKKGNIRAINTSLLNIAPDLRDNSTTLFINSFMRNAISISGNSTVVFNDAIFNHTTNQIGTSGMSHLLINHSIVFMDILLQINSKNRIINSRILKNLSVFDNSYAEIKNSTIREVKQIGPGSQTKKSILNFSYPPSNVSKMTTFKLNSTIYGYVDFPSTAGYFAIINVQRFFPVLVNYSDGSPTVNKLVNVTNSSNGVQVWAGYTNANGVANPNITFTSKNKAYNYTVKVNPSENISLLADTPIIFTLSDTTKPEVSKIKPNISNEDTSVNYNATVSDDVNLNECRLYIDDVLNGTMSIGVLNSNTANRSVMIPQPGIYSFLANCSDTSGNYNDTSKTDVRILDITPPSFNQTPQNKTLLLGQPLSYKINTTDNVHVDKFKTNDTVNFKINKTTGLLQNNTGLSLGRFLLNISVNDTSNNIRSAIISILVQTLEISNINVSGITNESAVINWTTNLASNTTLNYGTIKSFSDSNTSAAYVTHHSVILTDLKNHTLYFYNVTSCLNTICKINGTLNFTTKRNTNPVSHDPGGGGGGSSPQCTSMWLCDAWSDCINGIQTRLCEDVNGCAVSKTETQVCTVVQQITKPKNAGIMEPIKEVEKPAPLVAGVIEVPKATPISYSFLIWIIMVIFILLLLARRIDTFPLVLKEEEHYLKKDELKKAENLFDKMIRRFGKSKERERKYAERVKEATLMMEKEENELVEQFKSKIATAKGQIQPKRIIYKETAQSIYKETKPLSYEQALKEYRGVLDTYLASPPELREELKEKLDKSKRMLSELAAKKEDS